MKIVKQKVKKRNKNSVRIKNAVKLQTVEEKVNRMNNLKLLKMHK